MYSLLYEIFFCLKRVQKKRRENCKPESLKIQKVIDYIEWYYNIFLKRIWQKYPSSKYGITKEKRSQKIIVSLTSYPRRICTVFLTIETLLRQNMKPDMIIIWLANEQFPNGLEDLPVNLTSLQNRGLTIRFCDDIKSHKKYYYVMQEYPEDLIILVDDDMFYPRDLIKKLMQLHLSKPDDICCMTGQVITNFGNEKPSQWRNPYLAERFIHSNRIQIFTGSGSLFPPNSLDSFAFSKELINSLCLYADDLWLTFMALLKGTRITTYYPWRAFSITIYNTAIDALYYLNVENGQNDVQWERIINYFHNDLEEL